MSLISKHLGVTLSGGGASSLLPSSQGEKRQPYDEDIRVPLIVRGPGVKANTRASPIALSIDMASALQNATQTHCCMQDEHKVGLFLTLLLLQNRRVYG